MALPQHAPWLLAVLLVGAGPTAAGAQWVGPLTQLAPAPSDLADGRRPLAERLEAARRLGRHGPAGDAVATLLAALDSEPPPALRDEILRALARRRAPAAVPALRELLEGEAREPVGVVEALAAVGNGPAVDALLDALAREPTAAAAERALSRLGRRATPGLLAALAGPLPIHATRLLGESGDTTVVPVLLSRLDGAPLALRIALLRALGALGDERAAPALAEALSDPERPVRDAALLALGQVTAPAHAVPVLARLAAEGTARMRVAALRALRRVGPEPARGPLEAALAGRPGGRLRMGAVEVLVEAPHPRLVPALAGLLADPRHGPAAASALSRVDAGRGLPALLAASAAPAARDRAVAMALRRWELPAEQREAGLSLLASRPAGARRLLLRALARDPAVASTAVAALDARGRALRAAGARALTLLGDRAGAAAVASALSRERDPEVARRLLDAAAALDVALPWSAVYRHLASDATGAAAMRYAAARLRGHAPTRLRRALRRRLRAPGPLDVRATAARALAELGDRAAVTPLSAALDDPAPRLRAAAALALGALGGSRAQAALEAQHAIERDPAARAAVERALSLAPAAPLATLAVHGDRVLELHVVSDDGPPGAASDVELVLPDGRWLRVETLPGGELLVPDLPAGRARARVLGPRAH